MSMTCLQDFEEVKQRLKSSKKQQVVSLHKFIFENAGDRSNRQRLREFTGFQYNEEDAQYTTKLAYVKGNLTNADLMSICIILGLNPNEEKVEAHIFRNLCSSSLLVDILEDDDDDDDDDDYNNDEDENEEVTKEGVIYQEVPSTSQKNVTWSAMHNSNQHTTPIFSLNFRDVEDSIRPFDGSGKLSVETWVREFDEMAALMKWDQFQMMIFAKKSMKGLAKLFIMGERNITTWFALRKVLLEEFGRKIDSKQLSTMLRERRMRNDENIQEYFYNMKDLAAQGDVEESALIQYVIDGIKDTHSNKAMLYGADTIKEFKKKLSVYDMFSKKEKSQNERVYPNKKFSERLSEKKPTTEPRRDDKPVCFSCGTKGHLAAQCIKGVKCFKCNKFGHISRKCPEKITEEKVNNIQIVTDVENKDIMIKDIKISNQRYAALLDTGSTVNLITSSVYKQLGEPQLNESSIVLKGFGREGSALRPRGKINIDVEIDNDLFQLQFHVVTNDCMSFEVVIGRPVCEQAEISITPSGVHIKKLEEVAMMHINTQTDDTNIDVDIGHTASNTSKQIIQKMVNSYKPDKKKQTNVTMKITLIDETPIATGPRRLPLVERRIVDEQVDQWLKDEIIEDSNSEFSSPVVLAPKKDGGKRLCIDYRKINKIIVKDRFPLPLIEDQLDRLKDALWFSTIDLKNGFFHVPVEAESRKYTAFVTHNGQYQFRRVPFGLTNSPAVFQRHINAVFREMSFRGIALPYVDDVIIPGKNEQEALENVSEVLKQCRDYGLNIKWAKCHFLKREIEFLGHLIKEQTIAPSPTKKEVMLKYPLPKTLKQVESFLGLAGYFRKFIPDFAQIAKPLSDLKKKNVKFEIHDTQIASFNMLKNKLNNSPVLKIFNEEHITELHTDASVDGYGAVLMQKSPDDGKMHPVQYMSKKTTDSEKKFTSYELEILAVIEALKKFRVYLLGIDFKIITDCNAFATTMEKRDLSTRVARWLLLLQEYKCKIEHRSGSRMRHVDALSRNAVMMINAENMTSRVARAQQNDEELQPIFKILEQADTYNGFYLKAKVLFKLINDCELLVIPKSMEYELIKNAHDKGHFSIQKTKNLLSDYYIPKVGEKIQNFINNCVNCILINKKRGKQEGELNPLPKQDIPLHTYHVDHLGPLDTTSKKYKHIFAVIDGFTKFCWLYPTKSTTAKEVVSKLQLQSVTFGNPKVIISDRGTAFTAEEFEKYCSEEGIRHHKITTGLPRANGQIERLNSVIIAVLSKLSIDEPTKWYKHVSKTQQHINSIYHRGINTSPFEVLIGSKMRCKEDLQVKEIIEEEMISQYDEMRQQLRVDAKNQIAKMQDENRRSYNLRRKKASKYKIGDVVAIKRTQYGSGLKLRANYLGPYTVVTIKANDTYDVVKIGNSEGPTKTTTCAEYMKAWPDGSLEAFGAKV